MVKVGSSVLKSNKSTGFTIVELLIVIVVIGILAAIVIVAYNGVQSRAKQSSYKSAANSILKKAAAYNAANGAYPLCANGTSTDFYSSSQPACFDKSAQLIGITVFYDTNNAFTTGSYVYSDLLAAAEGTYSGLPVNTYIGGICGPSPGTGFKVLYPDPIAKANVMVTTGSGC